jgi:hypothetical protein
MEALRRILKKLNDRVSEHELGNPLFSNPQYNSQSLHEDNFSPIKVAETKRRIAFLDGGNQEIMGAPNFSLQINRIFFCIFEGAKRISPGKIPNKIEFYSATYSVSRENQIHYDTILFPIDESNKDTIPNEIDLSFNSMDPSVMNGNMRAGISRVASIARRFGEWEYSRHVVENELESGDIFVADGTLQAAFPNESRYVNRLFDSGKKSGVLISGLAKTCTLFTDSGLSLIGALRLLAKQSGVSFPMWFYYPIVDIFNPTHRAALYIVKLNPAADRVYRYEIFQDQIKKMSEDDLNEVMSALSQNSKDQAFPGYPYGLIVADEQARVRYNEMDGYQTMLLSEMTSTDSWEKFKKYIRATDTHDMLDLLAG